jgi:hypothetical protein
MPCWDRELIETLLCSHAMCVEVLGAVVVDELESDACRAILTAANAIIAQGGIVTCESLCNHTQDPSVCELLLSVQSRQELRQYSDADMINHFRLAVKQRAANRAVEEGIDRLKSGYWCVEEEAALLEQLVSSRREAQGWVAKS